MASNAQPERTLGPSLSIEAGAAEFSLGEYVLIRIPTAIQVDEHLNNGSTAASELPPTSHASSPQHFAFISEVSAVSDTSYELVFYPVLSFSRNGGALHGYNSMTDASKATLLPLPPLTLRHPTPALFGSPISLKGWTNSRESWLYTVPHRFVMPASRPFKRMNPPLLMPLTMLYWIDLYRERLRSNMQVTDANYHEQGSGNPRPGLTGGSPTIVGDGEGDQTAEGKLEEFSVTTSNGIPILEGVDEDAEGADATFLDELILLASNSPIWMVELKKYLEEEEKERKQVQEERAARLARWRESISN